jgi:hypothetical protein
MTVNNKPVEDVIVEQQELAKDLLNRFGLYANLTKRVMVAGGAPRDWEHNIAAKDLDIFLELGERQIGAVGEHTDQFDDPMYSRSFISTILNVPLEDVVTPAADEEYTGSLISFVYNINNLPYPVQVIGTRNQLKWHIREFPVSISQIAFDYEGNVYKSEFYKVGESFNTIYSNGQEQDAPYLARLMAKYPDRIEQSFTEGYSHMRLYRANVPSNPNEPSFLNS